ncbi:MAG: hypothetical protein R3277_08240 [Brumimicrobium sp.]|nr:hypothetical protein [Brumimicrobium sp.]
MELMRKKVIKGHNGAIYDIFCNDNVFAYTTAADKYVVRWDLSRGVQDDFTVRLEHTSFQITLDENNNFLFIGNSKGGIHVIDVKERREIKLLQQHRSPIFALVFDDKNGVFYSGDSEGYFCVWQADTLKLLLTLPLECGKIRQISLHPSGEYLVVCGQDGYVRILDTSFYNEHSKIKAHGSGVNCALFKEDLLYTGGKDAYLSLWDWRKGDKIRSVPAHNYAVYDLKLLNNGEQLVSGSFDKSIKLWQADTIEIIQRKEFKDGGHRHTVNRLCKTSESGFLSVSDDRQIIEWKLV